jgi:hypothetical protein
MSAEIMAVLIISEIMYNPKSNEDPPAKTEWVEIYNGGEEAADISGWYLADEDGRTKAIAAGTVVPPHTAVVLIPGEQTAEAFRAAWGEGFEVYPLAQWNYGGMRGLGNSPDAENEVLRLCRADGSVSDEVNYDDQGDWPRDKPDGPSIYVLPGQVDATGNDDGGHWRRSEVGVDGAQGAETTGEYSGEDVGSPGVVVMEEEQAASE